MRWRDYRPYKQRKSPLLGNPKAGGALTVSDALLLQEFVTAPTR